VLREEHIAIGMDGLDVRLPTISPRFGGRHGRKRAQGKSPTCAPAEARNLFSTGIRLRQSNFDSTPRACLLPNATECDPTPYLSAREFAKPIFASVAIEAVAEDRIAGQAYRGRLHFVGTKIHRAKAIRDDTEIHHARIRVQIKTVRTGRREVDTQRRGL
jgi:hypothetical protein